MFQQGDWVTIKYGEYSGSYGKVSARLKNGTYKILPYNKNNEPRDITDMDESGIALIEPMVFGLKELKEFALGKKLYRNIADRVFPPFNIRVTASYRMTADDIAYALTGINRMKDFLDAFKEWFWLIQNVLYDNLEIDGRYDEKVFSDMPETDDELFSTIYGLTEKLYWRLEERFAGKEESEKFIIKFDGENGWNDDFIFETSIEETAYKAVCDDIISRVGSYKYNKVRAKDEWILSPSQKRHIISSYEDDEALKKAGSEEKKIYKKSVRELSLQGDTQALKILAWGYFEGSGICRQSFRQAEKYLKLLYNKTGDPYAANALGYIYYHGYGMKDGPDPENAFKYYTYAAIAGVDEALYMTGDMLIHGKGTVRNIDVGINLIVDGYKESLIRFSEGEYMGRFADYALRMGNICRENIILGMGSRDAYKFYLEAKFSIQKRMSLGGLVGDTDVAAEIDEGIRAIKETYRPDIAKSILKADFPIYISHFFEDRFPVKIAIRKEGRSYYLKMSRFRIIPGDESKVLVAFPELSYVDLVSELSFRLEDVGVVKVPDAGPVFLADGFTKNEHTGALEFYANGDCVAAVEAKWFVIDVTKEKMLKKMDQGE